MIAGTSPRPSTGRRSRCAIWSRPTHARIPARRSVQYPLQGLPGVLPHIAEYLVPFAAPVQAFREAVAGHLAGDFPRLLAIALGWLALALMLAVRNYRLAEKSA